MRILYPEDRDLPPADRYLKRIDALFERAQPDATESPYDPGDIVSLVFSHQTEAQRAKTLHLTDLILERRQLADRHLADIQWRLDESLRRKPLRLRGPGSPYDDGKLTEVEKQILDLERQKRDVEAALWRDLLELRKSVVDERREYRAAAKRRAYFTEGLHADG